MYCYCGFPHFGVRRLRFFLSSFPRWKEAKIVAFCFASCFRLKSFLSLATQRSITIKIIKKNQFFVSITFLFRNSRIFDFAALKQHLLLNIISIYRSSLPDSYANLANKELRLSWFFVCAAHAAFGQNIFCPHQLSSKKIKEKKRVSGIWLKASC